MIVSLWSTTGSSVNSAVVVVDRGSVVGSKITAASSSGVMGGADNDSFGTSS